MVKFSGVHSSKNYTEALGASQCRWFNYWSLSGILFILQALTSSRKTILREDKTERLYSVSGLYVFKRFGVLC